MDSAAETLLIVVSSVLSVFLALACVALVYLIRVLKRVNQMADKAEEMAEKVESAADAVKKSATAIPFIRLINKIVMLGNKRGKD